MVTIAIFLAARLLVNKVGHGLMRRVLTRVLHFSTFFVASIEAHLVMKVVWPLVQYSTAVKFVVRATGLDASLLDY